MSHTRKTPPIKSTTANLPTDVDAGTMALDTTTNEQKVFNGTAWEVVEGVFIGTPTIVFDSTGPAYDQIEGDIPANWKFSDTSLKGLVIGTSCTSIADDAFNSCTGLTGTLVIPDSVNTIGVSAFNSCSGLTGSLLIPNSVTTIGNSAFTFCSGMTNINCYVEKSILDGFNVLVSSGVTTIHVRSTDATWTAGAGQTIGGKTGIEVIKDL